MAPQHMILVKSRSSGDQQAMDRHVTDHAVTDHAVIEGDCIKGMESVAAGSVDLVFADPPFNIGYDYDEYHDEQTDDAYLAWTEQWGRQVCRVLKDTGTFWLAIGDDFAAELKVLFQ